MSINRIHNINNPSKPSHQEIRRKMTIHEAGHATAIYLGNQQKGLLPVFFQITLTQPSNQNTTSLPNHCNDYVAKIEGGRLIQSLPVSFNLATQHFSHKQKLAYKRAFEADIINMLAGPLAEAKYIALRDNEVFNTRLVSFDALHYYGGINDLEAVNQYLNCFTDVLEIQSQTAVELFYTAFDFINHPDHWYAIATLAEYLLTSNKNVIKYEEIANVLDKISTKRSTFGYAGLEVVNY